MASSDKTAAKTVPGARKRSEQPHRSSEGKVERRKIRKIQVVAQEEHDVTERRNRAIEYLKTWKNDRTNWKFAKSIQNYILRHSFDRTLIPKNIFDDELIAYIKSLQGNSRILLQNKALDIVKVDLDEQIEEHEKQFREKKISSTTKSAKAEEKEEEEKADKSKEEVKLSEEDKLILDKEIKIIRSQFRRANTVLKALKNLGEN